MPGLPGRALASAHVRPPRRHWPWLALARPASPPRGHGKYARLRPPCQRPRRDCPELLYNRFTSKDQTSILDPVLKGEVDFLGFSCVYIYIYIYIYIYTHIYTTAPRKSQRGPRESQEVLGSGEWLPRKSHHRSAQKLHAIKCIIDRKFATQFSNRNWPPEASE